MLTGRHPFTANTPIEWAARHTTADPPPVDSFDATRNLEKYRADAVMRALGKLPSERPQSARELAALFSGGGAPRAEAKSVSPTLAPVPRAPRWPLAVGGAIGLMSAIAAAVIYLWPAPNPQPIVADRPDAGPPDAGPRQPARWLRLVHADVHVEDVSYALGPPDGRCATIRPHGSITLEADSGSVIASDGGPGPDVAVRVRESSAAYRTDVAPAPHQYKNIASEVLGSIDLDIDQFELPTPRYVRIKNRSEQPVCLDAIGLFRSG
jgi:serine/threonine-protein kinase